VVHVCIFDTSGRMLIQQRSSEKYTWPNCWDVSAAGGVGQGESSRQGAEREVLEELGYALSLENVRPSVTVNFPGGFDDYYIVTRDLDLHTLKLQKEEVSTVRWATQEEVMELLKEGLFVTYTEGFIRFLFEMRGRFGFSFKKTKGIL